MSQAETRRFRGENLETSSRSQSPVARNLNNNLETRSQSSKSVSDRSEFSSVSRTRNSRLQFSPPCRPDHEIRQAFPEANPYWQNYESPFSKSALSPQQSYLLQPKPVLLSEENMQGVDENIYHWKVLNLSRAKLKASSRTSALLSGFAMVAMVEINIDNQIPKGLLITFAACTVLLIAVHMLALMISTCILPNVEAVANLHFQTQKTVFESPHMTMSFIIELAWGFSTVLGILLFLVEIAILCWMKFYTISQEAAWVATGLLIPIFVIFIAFAALFYLKLVSHKSEVYESGIKELQLLKEQLEAENGDGVDESTALAGGNQNMSPGNNTRSGLHIV